LFLQTTALPAAASTGFGVNAEVPADPTMATVTCDDGAGLGAGAGEGVGAAAGDGLGLGVTDGDGALGDEYPLPPPHPAPTSAMTAITAIRAGNRMMETSWFAIDRRRLRRPIPRSGKLRATPSARGIRESQTRALFSLTVFEKTYRLYH
jgi:hypothetical protein